MPYKTALSLSWRKGVEKYVKRIGYIYNTQIFKYITFIYQIVTICYIGRAKVSVYNIFKLFP